MHSDQLKSETSPENSSWSDSSQQDQPQASEVLLDQTTTFYSDAIIPDIIISGTLGSRTIDSGDRVAIEEYHAAIEPYQDLFQSDSVDNNSIVGGFNSFSHREKLTGELSLLTLDRLIESYLRYNQDLGGGFRACARFDSDRSTLQALSSVISEKFDPKEFPIELEYFYPTGGDSFKVGIALNCEQRYLGLASGISYIGAGPSPFRSQIRSQNNPELSEKGGLVTYPALRQDIVNLQQDIYRKYGESRDFSKLPEGLLILDSPLKLDLAGQFQLATILVKTFGPGWSIQAVREHDFVDRPIRILVEEATGRPLSVCVADSDADTVELTEWAAVKDSNFRSVGAVVLRSLALDCFELFPGKTIYGEFCTSTGSLSQALRMGFSLPEDLPSVSSHQIIRANVPVLGALRDFVPLTFTDEMRQEYGRG